MSAVLAAAEAPPPVFGSVAEVPASAEVAFAQVEGGLAALGEQVLGGAVDDAALWATVARLERVVRAATAEKLRRVNELSTRSAAPGLGARSTADLLAGRLGLTKGEAQRQARTAEVLDGLPQTAERLRSGQIGVGQVEAAAQVFTDLGVADEATTQAFDALVADEAADANRRQLKDRLEDFTHRHAPDRLADRDRRAHARRSFRRWIDDTHGMWRCEGALPLAAGAAVDAAIDGIITRDQGPAPDAGAACAGSCDADHDHCPSGDRRSWEQKAADALVGMATQTIAAGDLPTVHGEAARVLVHVTDTDSPAVIDGAGAVSDVTTQQLLCDAERRYVTKTRNGAVLDAGRSRRDPTPKQRAAVIARDRTCVGCGTRAARCQVHHVAWYDRDAGPTDESNLVLLCWNCHHHVHHHGWHVTGDHIRGFGIDRTPIGARLPVSSGRRRTP